MAIRCVSLVLALLVAPLAGCVAGSLSARGWIAAPGVWSNAEGTVVLDASKGWGGWLRLSIDAEHLPEGWGGVGGGYRGVWTSDGDLDLVGADTQVGARVEYRDDGALLLHSQAPWREPEAEPVLLSPRVRLIHLRVGVPLRTRSISIRSRK